MEIEDVSRMARAGRQRTMIMTGNSSLHTVKARSKDMTKYDATQNRYLARCKAGQSDKDSQSMVTPLSC